jgi:hypothetical protein
MADQVVGNFVEVLGGQDRSRQLFEGLIGISGADSVDEVVEPYFHHASTVD